jgi:MoaD family protein
MSITVYIPTPFRRLAGNQVYVRTEGNTVAEVLDNLADEYPTLRHMIFDESEEVPAHINIYVNNQEIRTLRGKETPLEDGDEMAVIPAIAGGQVLTEDQVTRYSRHIIMPQVGPLGQRKHRRLRRGGRVQPAAAGPPPKRRRGTAQDPVRQGDPPLLQP